MSRYAAILLAAGLSTRMEQFKPLLIIDGQTITDRVISIFVQNGVDVYLVAGWQKEKLCSKIKSRDIKIIENPDYERGMFTSIQAGLSNLEPGYQAFFVMPVDIPLVRPSTIKRLLEASERNPGKILYPIFNKLRGHPPLIPICFSNTVLSWQNNGDLKAVLTGYENIAQEIIIPDSNILFDIDEPGDYEVALKRSRSYHIPTAEECEVILNDICHVDSARCRHCFKVAEVAVKISHALKETGNNVDHELIRASAILHDIAREQPRHDIVGGQLLHNMGFDRVGNIVAAHTFLLEELREDYLEAKVVYLADKFVQGDAVVTLEERFQTTKSRYQGAPEIETKIIKRKENADKVKDELEKLTGYSLEQVIFN